MSVPADPDRFPRQHPDVVSVVIPARDAAHLLPTQLAALSRQDYKDEWEVIVVDNASTDDTAEVAEAWKDRLPIRVVQASEKPGVNYARNVGFRSARGDLIAFCDADDKVSDSWLSSIVGASLHADAVGGAVDSTNFGDSSVLPLRNPKLTSHLAVPGGFLPSAAGGNLSVWGDVITSLGGFSEGYEYGADEVEFCWRLQLVGYRLDFSHDALVHIRVRDDVWAMARQFYLYGQGGVLLYRDFRSVGMPRDSLRNVLKGWTWLIVHLPDVFRDRPHRGGWVRIAGQSAGKLVGSVKNRTIYL